MMNDYNEVEHNGVEISLSNMMKFYKRDLENFTTPPEWDWWGIFIGAPEYFVSLNFKASNIKVSFCVKQHKTNYYFVRDEVVITGDGVRRTYSPDLYCRLSSDQYEAWQRLEIKILNTKMTEKKMKQWTKTALDILNETNLS